MAEYISRDELLKHLNECKNDPLFDPDMARICFAISIFIENMQVADVQPVKNGRWIGIYEYCEKNGYVPSGMGIYYWCSECDKAEKKTSDFCPNCGARMDLKDSDTNG